MKTVLTILVSGLIVAGCSVGSNIPLRSYDSSWWAQKDLCADGGYEACAEIGYAARGPIDPAPQTYQISQPIID